MPVLNESQPCVCALEIVMINIKSSVNWLFFMRGYLRNQMYELCPDLQKKWENKPYFCHTPIFANLK